MRQVTNRCPSFTPSRSRRISRQPRRGLSIIEVMIASLLMLFIALGVIPLFIRSISSNSSGLEYTEVSNHARARAEEMFQLPFSSPALTIPGGQTDLITNEYYSVNNQRWEDGTDPADATDRARWRRTTTVRQFSITAMEEDTTDSVFELDLDQALDGNANPEIVQLKEIEVTVDSTRITGPLGNKGQLTVWVLKTL